jgi:IS30 family transposase
MHAHVAEIMPKPRLEKLTGRQIQRQPCRYQIGGGVALRVRTQAEAALRLFVGDRLAEGWTPEQISGWLKSGNEPWLRAIGCETIYAFIYRTAHKAEVLWRYLTRRHKRRRPRRARASRDTLKDRASIHERPKTIESRGEAGHWEGDLIICKRTRPVLVLHERKSRVTLAARLIGKTAAETISAMRPHRSSSAKINHFRQRPRLRPARPAQDHARHDHLVLRRLCLMAKRRD